MKAIWVPANSEDVRETQVDSPGDVMDLLDSLSLEQTPAGCPALELVDGDSFLTLAPTRCGVVMVYMTSESSFSSVGELPREGQTVWYVYMGSASEVDARKAVPRNVATLAVEAFMRDSRALPSAPGLAWERD
jgi:hypothetical protein